MVHALRVLKISGILKVTGYSVGGEAAGAVRLLGARVAVAVRRGHFFFALLGGKRHVLGPERWVYAVLEHQVRTNIWKRNVALNG